MRVAAIIFGGAAICAVGLGSLTLGAGPAAANNDAADALAEKFAHAAEDAERAKAAKEAAEAATREAARKAEAAKRAKAARKRAAAIAAKRHKAAIAEAKRKEAERRAAYEADMLARARAEAEARRAEDRRKAEEQDRIEAERDAARADAARLAREAEAHRQEQEKRAEQQRRTEAARLAKEVEQKRLAEEREAEEQRKAEAARLAKEAEEKRLAEEHEAEEQRKAEAARLAKEAEEKRLAEEHEAEEQRKAEAARLAKEAEEQRRAAAARAALEARRTEEARRIAEKFRLAREARERQRATRNSLGGPPPPKDSAPAHWSDETRRDDARAITFPAHVTVLLVMEPQRRGFHRSRRTANPVLCVGDGCYVSSGLEAPAVHMRRWQTLGPGNTLGRRAGPCNRQLMCAFRDVELVRAGTWIQPISMGFWHHDRRDIRSVQPDPTCEVFHRQLYCAKPVIAHGYRAWIVPERVAAKAGANALLRALEDGLPTGRIVEREAWWAKVHALPTR